MFDAFIISRIQQEKKKNYIDRRIQQEIPVDSHIDSRRPPPKQEQQSNRGIAIIDLSIIA